MAPYIGSELERESLCSLSHLVASLHFVAMCDLRRPCPTHIEYVRLLT